MNKKIRLALGLGKNEKIEEIVAELRTMYEVEIVSDSEEAYHTIHVFKPDLAVLDFSLSKIHPIELYEGVALAHANVKFVLCVTEDNFQVAMRVWKRRSVDFIFKPFYPAQFVNNVNTIVRSMISAVEIKDLTKKISKLEAEIADLKKNN